MDGGLGAVQSTGGGGVSVGAEGECSVRSTGIGGRAGGLGAVHSTGGGGVSVEAEEECSSRWMGIGGGVWPFDLVVLGGAGGIAPGVGGMATGALTSKSVCAAASSAISIPSRDWKSRS
ncbi:hypothetical protein WU83_18275 [Mycobacterium nebraskense]|nr:hypothetical protein WU83_18275 [Mycobacterium nebraskense]